jgi:chaperonin GroES
MVKIKVDILQAFVRIFQSDIFKKCLKSNKPMKKIKPLGKNVLIKTMDAEEVTASGIVIPDTASKEKPQEGEVVAVGSSSKIDDSIKEGVRVLFKKYGGDEIEADGEEYKILDATEDILGIIEE